MHKSSSPWIYFIEAQRYVETEDGETKPVGEPLIVKQSADRVLVNEFFDWLTR